MKKRQQGMLTVEASMILTLLVLFILFLFSFARVYRAQSQVSHAAIQTADVIALESYLRETALQGDAADIAHIVSTFTKSTAVSSDSFESLRSANVPKIAKERFASAIASNEDDADQKLKNLGVKDGLEGIDFSACTVDLSKDDVIVAIKYTIEMQFPVFGMEEITVTKAAKAKTFGEILFEVSTDVNVPGWGTTTGDTKVTHGTNVIITATPNYGYVFDKWSDGSTDNPRSVTVTDAQHYTAIFKKDKFGVNLSTKNQYANSDNAYRNNAFGTVSGGGTYEYLDVATIKATPNTHYVFVGWDDNGDGTVDNTNATRSITVDKTYSFRAIFQPKVYTIKVNVNNSTYGSAVVKQGSKSGTQIQAEYGSNVQLIAALKNSTLYRFKNWNTGSTLSSISARVNGNAEYTANFEQNIYTVTFYNGNSKLQSTQVIRGSSIDGSKSYISSNMPSNPTKNGAHFSKWTYNGSTFNSSTKVNGNINVYAAWNCTVTFNGNGGSGSQTITVPQGSTVNFSNYGSSRGGYNFNGWYSGNTRYSGNQTINSNITVTASWSCAHPSRYEERTGTVCTGGTIYYKCSQCGANLGTGYYGGSGHSWSARCNVRHTTTSYFCGRHPNGCGKASHAGGCGGYHINNKYCSSCGVTHKSNSNSVGYYHVACAWCGTLSGSNWCGNRHSSAGGRQVKHWH